ncbi:NAD-dependent epimerase/dehydratase family protein [Algicella marina]|uniref:NAD-dependent epimerase/dehydratase family protein n=1 Tax=Algicella marina TaxID=2683284 RepID=A0A6P1T241_9RHOB|nr:SDR family oxidoreductase [Algicella marina]QHQ35791.1 NAD-dependent epimerase/dehydratase family protein [Algicella marina]
MKLAVTGGTGIAGRFIVAEALAAGDDVTILSRTPALGLRHIPYSLTGPAPDLSGFDAIVHAAFQHIPGRYRGGEGDDPAGFRAANLAGTLRLIEAAEAARLSRFVFLSSRAVYGPKVPGETLTEATPTAPNTLYGEVKKAAEDALTASSLPTVSLRATGIYGTGPANKWSELFAAFAGGKEITPRIGSEVHGADLAAAVRLALTTLPAGTYNVSDILLDRHDLLKMWSETTGTNGTLPPPAPSGFNEMDTTRLRAAGWQPGGQQRLLDTLKEIAGIRPDHE